MPPGLSAARKNFRVVVMGTAGVGKTSIINQFLHGQFTENHNETVEELHRHCMKFDGLSANIDILDTSGSYQFPAMRKLAIATGDAFVLVYSVDKPESFEAVKLIREQIKESKVKGKYILVIVANKTDLELSQNYDHAVTESVVCMDWEEKFILSSAKNDDNIGVIFQIMEEKMKERAILEEKRLTFFRRISLPVMRIAKPERSQKFIQLKSKSGTGSFDT